MCEVKSPYSEYGSAAGNPNQRETKEKLDYQNAKAGIVGLRQDASEPCRASLRERVFERRSRAQRESRNADKLMELEMLLEKHPEVARILELSELVGFGG